LKLMPSLIRLPLAAAMLCLAGAAFANDYPAKSIRLIVPAAPGGGADFLASLLTRRPDCAVLDLHMPDVSGFDVLQQLATAGDCLPVVIISGHSPPAADLARRGEAVIFLHKPVAEMALLGAISAAIANSAKTHFPQ